MDTQNEVNNNKMSRDEPVGNGKPYKSSSSRRPRDIWSPPSSNIKSTDKKLTPAGKSSSSSTPRKFGYKSAYEKPPVREYFCACNPRMKEKRIPTRLYSLTNRRFVCEDCMADDDGIYSASVVTDYFDWVSSHGAACSSEAICPLCRKSISDRDQPVRLTCPGYCLLHFSCAQEYYSKIIQEGGASFTEDLKCPGCTNPIYLPTQPKTNLQKIMRRFIKGLGKFGALHIRHRQRPKQLVPVASTKALLTKSATKRRPRKTFSKQPVANLNQVSPGDHDLNRRVSRATQRKALEENQDALLVESSDEEDPLLGANTTTDDEFGDKRKGRETLGKLAKRALFSSGVMFSPRRAIVFSVLVLGAFVLLYFLMNTSTLPLPSNPPIKATPP